MKFLITSCLLINLLGAIQTKLRFKSDTATLVGWLNLPEDNGQFPLIIMIQGSGGHSAVNASFKAHAEYFNKNGYAIFYYNKRGVDESTGNFEWTSFDQLAKDAIAAVRFLKKRSDIDANKIGLWGLSQGGWIGPLAARKSTDIKFVVVVSGPAVSPYKQKLYNVHRSNQDKGLTGLKLKQADDLLVALLDYYANPTGKLYQKAQQIYTTVKNETWLKTVNYAELRGVTDQIYPPSVIKQLSRRFSGIQFNQRPDNFYDPIITLKELKIPLLMIYGKKDKIINVPRTVKLLKQQLSNKNKLTIKLFKDGNHGFVYGRNDTYSDNFVDGYFENYD